MAARRVSVHADSAVVDAVLPGAVPVAVIIPSVVDMLRAVGGFGAHQVGRYQLSRLGDPAMDAATTLSDNEIRDGDILVLAPGPAPQAVPRHHDPAGAVSATLAGVARPWGSAQSRLARATAAACLTGVGGMVLGLNALSHNAITAAIAAAAATAALLGAAIAQRSCRDRAAALALNILAVLFAAVAGVLAVPGPPDVAHSALAASAAAATAVLATLAGGRGGVTLSAVACLSVIVAAATLAGAITGAPLRTIASVSTLACLGLLGAAGRVSIMLAGLSPRLDAGSVGPGVHAAARRADRWLTVLLAAFGASAAAAAVATVLAGAPCLSCIAFGVLTGALLLLRSRGADIRRAVVFVVGGTAVIATTFAVSAAHATDRGPLVAAATAVLAAAAMGLGFVAPTTSPLAGRAAEVLEWSALVATVPLTFEICGIYAAVRGFGPP
nr:type VII secretion integral membrane protein EccD [Mycobacterium sp. Marseille-P9652]